MPGASRTFKYSVIMLILFAVRRTEDNFVSFHSQIQLICALQIIVLFATPAFIQRTAINGLLSRSSIQRHGG